MWLTFDGVSDVILMIDASDFGLRLLSMFYSLKASQVKQAKATPINTWPKKTLHHLNHGN